MEALLPMLAGEAVPSAGGRVTTVAGVQSPRVPIWVAGTAGRTAGPRRVSRHGVEGLALVGVDTWTPDHVTDALRAGSLTSGAVDVVLVGGVHPDPDGAGSCRSDMVRAGDPPGCDRGRGVGCRVDVAALSRIKSARRDLQV